MSTSHRDSSASVMQGVTVSNVTIGTGYLDLFSTRCEAVVIGSGPEMKFMRGLGGAAADRSYGLLRTAANERVCSHGLLGRAEVFVSPSGPLSLHGIHRLFIAGTPNLQMVRSSQPDESHRQHLCEAVYNALSCAAALRLSSIAFPLLSTGEFKYPPALAAFDILRAIRMFITANKGTSLQHVYTVCNDRRNASMLPRALRDVFGADAASAVQALPLLPLEPRRIPSAALIQSGAEALLAAIARRDGRTPAPQRFDAPSTTTPQPFFPQPFAAVYHSASAGASAQDAVPTPDHSTETAVKPVQERSSSAAMPPQPYGDAKERKSSEASAAAAAPGKSLLSLRERLRAKRSNPVKRMLEEAGLEDTGVLFYVDGANLAHYRSQDKEADIHQVLLALDYLNQGRPRTSPRAVAVFNQSRSHKHKNDPDWHELIQRMWIVLSPLDYYDDAVTFMKGFENVCFVVSNDTFNKKEDEGLRRSICSQLGCGEDEFEEWRVYFHRKFVLDHPSQPYGGFQVLPMEAAPPR